MKTNLSESSSTNNTTGGIKNFKETSAADESGSNFSNQIQESADSLPKGLSIPSGIQFENVNINFDKLKSFLSENNGKEAGDKDPMCLSPNNKLYYQSGMENVKQQIFDKTSTLNKPKRNLMSEGKKTGSLRSKSNNPNNILKIKNNDNADHHSPLLVKNFDIETPQVLETGIFFPGGKVEKKTEKTENSKDKSEKKNNKLDTGKALASKVNKPRAKLMTRKDITKLKLPENLSEKTNNKQSILLNTVQFNNNDKWEKTENNESIEEIYEIEEGYNPYDFQSPTNDDDKQNKTQKFNSNEIEVSVLKNDEIEEKVDMYYDIPIKDRKKTNFNKDYESVKYQKEEDNPTSVTNANDISKHKIIDEILNDNFNVKRSLNDSLNRPFTPPFNKYNNIDYENYNNNPHDSEDLVSKSTGKVTLDEKVKINKYVTDQFKEELVYDYVLECYYNPQTNEYFELEK